MSVSPACAARCSAPARRAAPRRAARRGEAMRGEIFNNDEHFGVRHEETRGEALYARVRKGTHTPGQSRSLFDQTF
jgi:hypothetical protein